MTNVQKTYEEMTTEELRNLVRERNESREGNGVRIGKTKDDIIANLREDDFLESADRSTRYVETSSTLANIPLEKIEVSPFNPRPECDYHSPSLQASILKSGGLNTPITVYKESDVVTNGSEDKYFVLGGNRRFVNYKSLVQTHGFEPVISCVVRSYSGSSRSVRAQVLAELENDNESLMFSPVDRLRLVNQRLKDGRSQQSVAKERGWSDSYISQLMRLNRLPEEYLNRVHYGCRIDELKEMTTEELKEAGVPFTSTSSGEVAISGITYNNAQLLASMIPKVQKNFSVKELADHEDLVNKYHTLFMEDEFLAAASRLTESELKYYANTRVNEVILGLNTPVGNPQEAAPPKNKEELNEKDDWKDESPSQKKKPVDLDTDTLGDILKQDVDGFVVLMTRTNNDGYFVMEIPDGWQDEVAPLLAEDAELRKAIAVLIDREVIVDQRNYSAAAE